MKIKKIIETIIFGTRWLLIPFYLGLILALFCYMLVFGKEVFHMLLEIRSFTVNQSLLIMLELLDMAMIANLIKMIATGSYNSFVSKEHGYKSENISSGMLKVKMSTSIVGVSSVHLLKVFINAAEIDVKFIIIQVGIHSIFLIGALILAHIDVMHVKSEAIESQTERDEHEFEHKNIKIH